MRHKWKYVDNFTIIVDVNNAEPAYSNLENTINNLYQQTLSNGVTMKAVKTVVMHINLLANSTPLLAVALALTPSRW